MIWTDIIFTNTPLPVIFVSLLICHCGITDSLPLSSQLKSIISQTRVLRSDILGDTKLERIRRKANRKMIKQRKIIVPLVLLGGSICVNRSGRHKVSYSASNSSGWIRERVCNQNCRGNPIITVNFTLEHQTMSSCASTYKLNIITLRNIKQLMYWY